MITNKPFSSQEKGWDEFIIPCTIKHCSIYSPTPASSCIYSRIFITAMLLRHTAASCRTLPHLLRHYLHLLVHRSCIKNARVKLIFTINPSTSTCFDILSTFLQILLPHSLRHSLRLLLHYSCTTLALLLHSATAFPLTCICPGGH